MKGCLMLLKLVHGLIHQHVGLYGCVICGLLKSIQCETHTAESITEAYQIKRVISLVCNKPKVYIFEYA